MLTPSSTAERDLSSRGDDRASRATSKDRSPRRSATPECGPHRLCEPARTVLYREVGRTALLPESVENLLLAPSHHRTSRAGYTVLRSETTLLYKSRDSASSCPTPMAVSAAGYDLLVTVASRPSTPAGAIRPMLRRDAAGVWEATLPLPRPDQRRKSLHHLDSRRGNEGCDAVR